MESGARPPLLTPHEPLPHSVSSEEPPVWEPNEQLARPPPLPCPAPLPSGRALTAKQYKELSVLPAVLQQGAQNAAPLPLLPTDLPSVKKLLAAGGQIASDSEGAVTSKREARKLAAAAAAAAAASKTPRSRPSLAALGPAATARVSKETPEAEELANLLEETLEEETLEEETLEDELKNKKAGDQVEDVDLDTIEIDTIEIDLANDPGTGSIKERATRTALKAIGYVSWEAFTAELSKTAAATIAAATANGAATTRRKPKPKPASSIKVDQVINSSSYVYHPAFKKAYSIAKTALEKKEAAKRKAQELEDHSTLVPRWSSISAADHTWYLKHEGHQLIGADAERYATLTAKIEAEKLEYWAAVEAEARAHTGRYQQIGPRQSGQLEADLKVRRTRVIESMSQFWKLRNVVDFAVESSKNLEGAGRQNKNKELFSFQQKILQTGKEPTLLQLPPGTILPGNKLYLPAEISEKAGPRPGEAGAVYRKACSAALWDDADFALALQKANTLFEQEEEYSDVRNSEYIVCATAGAMLCMLRSSLLHHSPAWQIPVCIQASTNLDDKRTIYLGKPVVAEKETIREKQQRLQKYAIITEGLASDPSHRPKPSNAEPGPREAAYYLATITSSEGSRIPLCIRTHGRVVIQPKNQEENVETETDAGPSTASVPPPSPPLSAILGVSTEYLPEPDIEQDTPEELATWWAKLVLTPGADSAAVAHVHVPSNRIVDWKFWNQRDIALEFGNILDIEASAKCTLDTIIKSLKDVEPGKYLIQHKAGGKSVEILKEETQLAVEVEEQDDDNVYDLHASQAIAGEIDTSTDPFVPPKWRPYREDVAQVPFTFPPEVHTRGRGGGGGAGRKRQRKQVWQGDLDQVQHVATISRSEYAAQLLEEL